MEKLSNNENGQVLLLSALVLSGVIISVSFFVGYLTVKRLRQATLAVDSAQAFYLADSGREFELWKALKNKNSVGDAGCPSKIYGFPAGAEIISSIEISPDSNKSDSYYGFVIKATGKVNEKVSRSQKDISQGISSSDYYEAGYNGDLFDADGNHIVQQTKTTSEGCE